MTVIRRRAHEADARLTEVDEVWKIEETVRLQNGCYRAIVSSTLFNSKLETAPSLAGEFQVGNALTAATATRLLIERGFPVTDAATQQGVSAARWPGRLERLSDRPAIYLDGAHNPAAARELRKFWDENYAGRRILLVYGAMRDKAVDEIAGLLFPRSECVILTQPRQSRAISVEHLAEMTASLARNSLIVANPAQALERALSLAAPDDVIFATGSLFLVGDLRHYWKSRVSSSAIG